MLDLALGFHFFQERHQIELFTSFPDRNTYVMDKIHIDAVNIKSFQLFVEEPFHVFFILGQPNRHLISQQNFFSVSVLEGFAENFF